MGFDDIKIKYPSIHTQKAVIDGIRRSKKIGDLPPIYPNGWFIILETDDLPIRKTKQVNVLGITLAVKPPYHKNFKIRLHLVVILNIRFEFTDMERREW